MNAQAYQKQTLAGATGIGLIIALYDGAIRFLFRAKQAAEEDNVIDRRFAVKRALDILMYLQARLRPDVGGKPAEALSDFYSAMFHDALEASAQASPERFMEVIRNIQNVREAWVIAARDPAANRVLPRELRTPQERATSVTKVIMPGSKSSYSQASNQRWSA